MKNEYNKVDELFNKLQGQFDIDEPRLGHQERFLEKLASQNRLTISHNTVQNKRSGWWKPMMFAASIALLLGLYLGNVFFNSATELEEVSPQMAETQVYFTSLIEQELAKVKLEENEDTAMIIEDAMTQLEKLEADYDIIRTQLIENGEDKRLIHAMIQNFQNRIDLLQTVLLQIDEVKLLKKINNENNII